MQIDCVHGYPGSQVSTCGVCHIELVPKGSERAAVAGEVRARSKKSLAAALEMNRVAKFEQERHLRREAAFLGVMADLIEDGP